MLNEEEGSFLVFSRTKHGAERIGRKLEKLGHKTATIHGDRTQAQRTSALKKFSEGKSRVLVATDVAARGIDVSHIAHVVNYDLPNGSDDFVHRIGRTGRAGAKGVATTFVTPLEKGDAKKLERELKISFEWRVADKDLAKEERNRPIDLNSQPGDDLSALLAMETRSWKKDGAEHPHHARQHGSHHTHSSSDTGRSHAGKQQRDGRSSGSSASGGRSAGRRRRRRSN
jgi:ATP-dependent RNA helicase RhlE